MQVNPAAMLHSETVRDESTVNQLAGAAQNYDVEGLQRAAEEFEAFFMQQLLSVMRQTVPDGGFIQKDHAHEVFEGMLDEALSGEVARAGGIGLANMIVAQLSAKLAGY